MNKAKIFRASKALQRLENIQERFNEAITDLSDEELTVFCKENHVTIEPSQAKERIKKLLDAKEKTNEGK